MARAVDERGLLFRRCAPPEEDDAAPPLLARRTAELIARLRSLDLFKAPGAAEAVDWTRLLHRLGAHDLDEPFVRRTLGAIIKDPDDLRRVHGELEHLLS